MMMKGDCYSLDGRIWYHYSLLPTEGLERLLKDDEKIFIGYNNGLLVSVPFTNGIEFLLIIDENSKVNVKTVEELVKYSLQLARDLSRLMKKEKTVPIIEYSLPTGDTVKAVSISI